MENEQPRDGDQPTDESVEEFKQAVEEDPSTASESEKDEESLNRLRGG